MKFPQIGELLPNGHTVDAAYCVGEDRYVLAHRDGAPEPYAVWAVDKDGDTRNGRYFTDPVRAQRYFAKCCYDWREEATDLADDDYAEEIIIRYACETFEMSVIINGERKKDIKTIEIKATDMRPPQDYQCTMYAPVPLSYRVSLPKHLEVDHGEASPRGLNAETVERSFSAVARRFAERFHESMQKQHQQYRLEQRAAAQLTPEIQTAIKNIHSINELELFVHFWWLTNKYLESDIHMERTLWIMHQHFSEDKQIL